MKKYHVCHTQEQLHNLAQKLKTKLLIVFVAEECYPCESLKRILSAYQPKFDLHIVFINTTLNPDVASAYDVMGAPQCVVIDDNCNVIDNLIGFADEEKLDGFLNCIFV